MVNGQYLRTTEWNQSDSMHSENCAVVKGDGSPSTSEWTQPTIVDGDSKLHLKAETPCIVLNAAAPFKVKEACEAWLALFQFRESDVIGRSFRVCHGPKTDQTNLKHVINNAASAPHAEIVLYSKNGDEITVTVRSSLGADSDNPSCVLRMTPSAHNEQTEQQSNTTAVEHADLVLGTETETPFDVKEVGAAFLALTGYPELRLREEGVGMLIGPGADGIKWKNLLNHGMAGTERECYLKIVSVHGSEVPVKMRVVPRMDTPSAEANSQCAVRELAFVCTEARDRTESSGEQNSSPETSSSSFSSFGAHSASDDGSFNVSSASFFSQSQHSGLSPRRAPSNVDRSVLVHLQAMKLAKAKHS